MKLHDFLKLTAGVTGVLGLALVVAPSQIVTFFSDGMIPNETHFVQYLGTSLMGFGVLNWYGQSVAERYGPHAALPGIYGNLVSLVTAIIIDVIGIGRGTLNMRSWLILALHLVFAYGFMYFARQLRGLEASGAHR